jgi:hypothetical protein
MAVPLLAGGGCYGHGSRPHPPTGKSPLRPSEADYTADMVRGRTAALSAAFVLVAAAAVSAGCGGGSSSSALSLDPVAAAATKTQDAGAARIRLSMAFTSHGKTVKLRASGAMDGTSTETSFKLRSLLGLGGLSSAAKSKLSHGSMQEVALEQDGDYVVYMRIPFLMSQLPGGAQWIKLDLSQLGKSAGVDLGKLMSGSQLQPADLLSALKADGKVHKVGSATIDGAATTHYRVTVNLAKALKSKGLTSPLLKNVAVQAKSISENVWIGKDGLVRRVAVAYGRPQRDAPQSLTMDIYDYGTHVDIAAPSSDQVFDATQLAQQGLAGALH